MNNKTIQMDIDQEINTHIDAHSDEKRNDLRTIHTTILQLLSAGKLWFLDGKNTEGKIVSNPNIGYGICKILYADGTTKEFYQIGLSANTTGISVYIMGLDDKKYLQEKFEKTIGKAKVTGYCIKFKNLKDIDYKVLQDAMVYGISQNKIKS